MRVPSEIIPTIVLSSVLALSLGLAISVSGLLGPAGDQESPVPLLPFDAPLDGEKQLVINAALADSLVIPLLGDHHAILGASLHTDKPSDEGPEGYHRSFDVWFYNYTANHVVHALVEAFTLNVTSVEKLPGIQPPLAGVEVERAVSLAMGDEFVAQRIALDQVEATTMLVNGEATLCPIDRCVLVAFIVDGAPSDDVLVLVDLSQDEVLRVTENGSWQEAYRP